MWGVAAGFLYAVIGITANVICIKTALHNPPYLNTYGYLVPKDSVFCHVPFISWMVTVSFFTSTPFLVALITIVSGIVGALLGQIFWRIFIKKDSEISAHL